MNPGAPACIHKMWLQSSCVEPGCILVTGDECSGCGNFHSDFVTGRKFNKVELSNLTFVGADRGMSDFNCIAGIYTSSLKLGHTCFFFPIFFFYLYCFLHCNYCIQKASNIWPRFVDECKRKNKYLKMGCWMYFKWRVAIVDCLKYETCLS